MSTITITRNTWKEYAFQYDDESNDEHLLIHIDRRDNETEPALIDRGKQEVMDFLKQARKEEKEMDIGESTVVPAPLQVDKPEYDSVYDHKSSWKTIREFWLNKK